MQFLYVFDVFGPWKNLPQMAPNRARRIFVPTDPDLADILGRTDSDFEICFFDSGSHISGIPGPQISKICPGPGHAWASGWTGALVRLGPRAGPRVGRAGLGPRARPTLY